LGGGCPRPVFVGALGGGHGGGPGQHRGPLGAGLQRHERGPDGAYDGPRDKRISPPHGFLRHESSPLLQSLSYLLHVPPHGLHPPSGGGFPQHVKDGRHISIHDVAVRTVQSMPTAVVPQKCEMDWTHLAVAVRRHVNYYRANLSRLILNSPYETAF